jgi:hypothetical protein
LIVRLERKPREFKKRITHSSAYFLAMIVKR